MVLTQTAFAVTDAVDGEDTEEGEYGADGGFGEYVGAGKEDRGLRGDAEYGEWFHEALLVTGGNDIGAVGGQVVEAANDEVAVVTAGGELHQRT